MGTDIEHRPRIDNAVFWLKTIWPIYEFENDSRSVKASTMYCLWSYDNRIKSHMPRLFEPKVAVKKMVNNYHFEPQALEKITQRLRYTLE